MSGGSSSFSVSLSSGQAASAMPAIADGTDGSRSSSVRSVQVRKDTVVKRSSSLPKPRNGSTFDGQSTVRYQQMNQVFHEAPNAELLQAAATEVLQSRMSEQEATRQAEQHVSRMQNETAQAVNQIRTEATHAVTEAFLSSQSQVAAQTQVEAAQSLAASAQELAQTRSQFEAREQQLLAQIHSLQAAATDARRETDMMNFHSLNVAGKDDEL